MPWGADENGVNLPGWSGYGLKESRTAALRHADCTGSRSLGMGGVFLTRTCNSEGNTYGLRAGQNAKPDHAFGQPALIAGGTLGSIPKAAPTCL